MSASLSTFSGFDTEVVSYGSDASNYPEALAQSVEDVIGARVVSILAPKPEEKQSISRARIRELFSAVTRYLVKNEAGPLKKLGFDVNISGTVEALAFSLLGFGYPEMAVQVVKKLFSTHGTTAFLPRFFPVFHAAVFSARVPNADPDILESVNRAAHLFLEYFQKAPVSGYEFFVLWKLHELALDESRNSDLQKAFKAYSEGLYLGEEACAIALSELYFQNNQDSEGLRVLEEAWLKFCSITAAEQLANQYFLMGRVAESIRYFRIISGARKDRGEAIGFPPNEASLSFPRDMITIQTFLLSSESSENFTYLRRPVLASALQWIHRAFQGLSAAMERFEHCRWDGQFKDRLMILQFGAIECANSEIAIRYLDEIATYLSLETGKDFLTSFFYEHSSDYSLALNVRVEKESLAEIRDRFGIGIFEASSDMPRETSVKEASTESVNVPEKDQSPSFWDALVQHLIALSYRFSHLGDEEILDRIYLVSKLLDDADDGIGENGVHIATEMETTIQDLKKRTNRFNRLPETLQEWYLDLRAELVSEQGESFVRALLTNAYHVLPISGAIPVRAHILYLCELLIADAPVSGEIIRNAVEWICSLGPDTPDFAFVCDILNEFEYYTIACDTAFMGDVSDPRILRHLLKALVEEDVKEAKKMQKEILSMLADRGIQSKSLADYIQEQCDIFADHTELLAIAKGNLALIITASAPPEMLAQTVLPIFDEAAFLGDLDSAFSAARICTYHLHDREGAEERLKHLFHSGIDTAMLELVEVQMFFGDFSAAAESLATCEQLNLHKTISLRIRLGISGGREEQISAIRLAGDFIANPPETNEELPKFVLEQCLLHALREISVLWIAKVEFDSKMRTEAYMTCLRFIALLPPEMKFSNLQVPKNMIFAYWETLTEALQDPMLQSSVAAFLRETIDNEEFLDILNSLLSKTSPWDIDKEVLPLLIAEFKIFRETYGIPDDPSQMGEEVLDVETQAFLSAIHETVAWAFLSVRGGGAFVRDHLASARSFHPNSSAQEVIGSPIRH